MAKRFQYEAYASATTTFTAYSPSIALAGARAATLLMAARSRRVLPGRRQFLAELFGQFEPGLVQRVDGLGRGGVLGYVLYMFFIVETAVLRQRKCFGGEYDVEVAFHNHRQNSTPFFRRPPYSEDVQTNCLHQKDAYKNVPVIQCYVWR